MMNMKITFSWSVVQCGLAYMSRQLGFEGNYKPAYVTSQPAKPTVFFFVIFFYYEKRGRRFLSTRGMSYKTTRRHMKQNCNFTCLKIA